MMTESDFNTTALATGISDDILALVKRVLVDGEPATRVAASAGLSSQRIYAACKRMTMAFGLLGGWVGAPVVLPLGMHEDLTKYGLLLQNVGLNQEMLTLHSSIRERIETLLANEALALQK